MESSSDEEQEYQEQEDFNSDEEEEVIEEEVIEEEMMEEPEPEPEEEEEEEKPRKKKGKKKRMQNVMVEEPFQTNSEVTQALAKQMADVASTMSESKAETVAASKSTIVVPPLMPVAPVSDHPFSAAPMPTAISEGHSTTSVQVITSHENHWGDVKTCVLLCKVASINDILSGNVSWNLGDNVGALGFTGDTSKVVITCIKKSDTYSSFPLALGLRMRPDKFNQLLSPKSQNLLSVILPGSHPKCKVMYESSSVLANEWLKKFGSEDLLEVLDEAERISGKVVEWGIPEGAIAAYISEKYTPRKKDGKLFWKVAEFKDAIKQYHDEMRKKVGSVRIEDIVLELDVASKKELDLLGEDEPLKQSFSMAYEICITLELGVYMPKERKMRKTTDDISELRREVEGLLKECNY